MISSRVAFWTYTPSSHPHPLEAFLHVCGFPSAGPSFCMMEFRELFLAMAWLLFGFLGF